MKSGLLFLTALFLTENGIEAAPEWNSPRRCRILLEVDSKGRQRSHSPARGQLDFKKLTGGEMSIDESTVEVIGYDDAGRSRAFRSDGDESTRGRVPHRLDRFFGSKTVALNFVVPDTQTRTFAVYFDAAGTGTGEGEPEPAHFGGMIGDGDLFREGFKRREIAGSHFDQFVDFDGDGDLDLFKGGVEPFVFCYENAGGNRMVDRGKLTSGGEVFVLPKSRSNRSWVTVAFFDLDGDGDQDFFPGFGDGPDAGQIIHYRNTTREHGGVLTFTRVGALRTAAGVPLAGGAQAGGWFPSVGFVRGLHGGETIDALVGSNHRCWLYRGADVNADGTPPFAGAEPVKAGGADIVLTNPRFDAADADHDGDIDLFAGCQPGPIHYFKNTGTRERPEFAAGVVVAFDGKYLIGDAHSGVEAADFDSDGLVDIAAGRFWERTDLNKTGAPRDYGGFWKNTGDRTEPRFEKQTAHAPFTEQFQPCDAIRQNSVRAMDWDGDGTTDLLAGDTDGFIWFFRSLARSSRREEALTENSESEKVSLLTSAATGVFANGEKLMADGKPLSVTESGGHARFDVCDWNNDGLRDFLVADGHGTLTLFLNNGSKGSQALAAGVKVHAGDNPVQIGGRASVLVCDWNSDSRKDVVLADDKGFYFCRNNGTDAAPLLAPPAPITFGGKTVSYVRPNLGSFVDWDGDGRKDFIAGHFENSIRFYKNSAPGAPGIEPQFTDSEGVVIVQATSPQMISGADAVDWNGDGDIDILTGQGHGGSGLRFYERDWIEDEQHGTRPVVNVGKFESK